MPWKDEAYRKAYHKAWAKKNKDKIKTYAKRSGAKWRAKRLLAEDAAQWKESNAERLRTLRKSREYFATNRANYLRKKSKAVKRGLLCTITREDILAAWPKDNCCPIFRTPFQLGGGRSKNNATIDRLDSSKGYVPGNICIISHRANTIKNDATAAELFKVAHWVLLHVV